MAVSADSGLFNLIQPVTVKATVHYFSDSSATVFTVHYCRHLQQLGHPIDPSQPAVLALIGQSGHLVHGLANHTVGWLAGWLAGWPDTVCSLYTG